MAPKIFFIFSTYFFFDNFIKNPQTTKALTFLTHIILAISGVVSILLKKKKNSIPICDINILSNDVLNEMKSVKVDQKVWFANI